MSLERVIVVFAATLYVNVVFKTYVQEIVEKYKSKLDVFLEFFFFFFSTQMVNKRNLHTGLTNNSGISYAVLLKLKLSLVYVLLSF